MSPFHRAAESDRAEIVRLLLKHGLDPDMSGYGATALHRSCSWGSVNVARLLVHSGRADLNKVDTSFSMVSFECRFAQ